MQTIFREKEARCCYNGCVGSPFEFDHNNYKHKDFALLSKKSHFTDDTVMTVAVARGLMAGQGDAPKTFGYDLSRTCDEIRPSYRHVETCQQTVPEAITAFLESTGFEDALRNAVSLGGDPCLHYRRHCRSLLWDAAGVAAASPRQNSGCHSSRMPMSAQTIFPHRGAEVSAICSGL